MGAPALQPRHTPGDGRLIEFEGDDAAATLRYVVSANLKRWHLTPAQRSMIGAEIATGSRHPPKRIGDPQQRFSSLQAGFSGGNLSLAEASISVKGKD